MGRLLAMHRNRWETDSSSPVELVDHAMPLSTFLKIAARDPITIAFFALVPLNWYTMLSIGGATLQPYHLAYILLIAAGAIRFSQYIKLIYMALSTWGFFYMCYLSILFFSVLVHGDQTLMFSVIRQSLYLIGAFIIIVRAPRPETLYVACLSSMLALLLFLQYCAAEAGINLLGAAFEFLTTGNFQNFTYHVMRAIFNVGNSSSGIVKAGIRNDLASAFAMLFMITMATRNSVRYWGKELVQGALSAIALLFVIMLLSRSVIISLFICSIFIIMINIFFRGRYILGVFLWTFIILCLLSLAVVTEVKDVPLLDTISQRFTEPDRSVTARIDQWGVAAEIIEDNFWLGMGEVRTPYGDVIHNLFLGAWARGGFFAFLSVASFYIWLLVAWWAAWPLLRPGGPAEHMGLSGPWTFALMVLPLFRVWLAGDGGQLTAIGWTLIATYQVLVCHGRASLAQRSTRVRRAAPAAERWSGHLRPVEEQPSAV